jgi:hypothetical protein
MAGVLVSQASVNSLLEILKSFPANVTPAHKIAPVMSRLIRLRPRNGFAYYKIAQYRTFPNGRERGVLIKNALRELKRSKLPNELKVNIINHIILFSGQYPPF